MPKNYFTATKFFFAVTLMIRNRKIFAKFFCNSFKIRLGKAYLPKSEVDDREALSLCV